MKNNLFKSIVPLVFIAIAVFGVIYGGIALTKDLGKSKKVVTMENATEALDHLYSKITVNQVTPRKEPVTLETTSLKDSLPDISKYPVSVEPSTDLYIEIFASPEKAGEKKDGWLNDMAQAFNAEGIKVNGQPVSVKIRSIASGVGMDYIVSEKYTPDVFSPSNELWGEMIKAQGVKAELVEKRMAGNVPGLLMSKAKNDELIKKYGSINLKTVSDAVANNEIAMGYTNPFASSTGLNFLVSTLSTFDNKNPLSETAVAGFEKFQANIPFVAYTTLQMRESAQSGVLDGFIMEYQTFINTPELKSDYVFTPFGARHDNPIYAIGELSADKQEILKRFIEFCKSDESQRVATDYGFNQLNDYESEIETLDGETITAAQKLWKEKKNGNKAITAVFVSDVSGSMEGEPLNKLKQSLLSASQYIGKDNSVGLVTYSDDVNINLPIGKFDINQRSLFTGAVNDMEAVGGTATFDGIIVAAKMLLEEKIKNPDTKLMLFVLSDGDTNRGHSLHDVEGILKALKIPVYTIGYNANIKALQSISSINEAASINADSDDVVYQLSNLFNAQM